MVSCPNEQLLARLLVDNLPPAERAPLETHVEQCRLCQRVLDDLTDDPELRCEAPTGPAAMQDLRHADSLPAGAADTGAGPNRAGAPHLGDWLRLLSPATEAGSLGRLGDYEVLELIGTGGMGAVFRARDRRLQRVVALKVLLPHLAASDDARRRFEREARAAAAVSHDNVVPVYDVGQANGIPFLVMQHVAGVSLQDRLRRGPPLDVDEVVRIGREVLAGLAAAHAAGLIHRDIKPANILLEAGSGRVKVSDFGLARAVDDASLTGSGVVAGTPLYMSPEQADGLPVDARSDLFSLGSVLYVLCTGRPPFEADSTPALLRRICEQSPVPVRERNPAVPAWLNDVIARLHGKNPAARFPSAHAVADALTRGQAPPPHRPPARSRRAWSLAGGSLLLMLVGAIAWYRNRPDALQPEAPTRAEKDEQPAPVDDGSPPRARAPFHAWQARPLQEAWARHLGTTVVTTNSQGAQMVLIPPGEFLMGSTPKQNAVGEQILNADPVRHDPNRLKRLPAEMPQHRVVLTKPFLMGATEVTVAQFREFVEATKYRTEADKGGGGNSGFLTASGRDPDSRGMTWRAPGIPQNDECPVCQVSWNDACAFCVWLSEREERTPWYQPGAGGRWMVQASASGYRLPTEAEWEYACRAGTMTQFSFGDDPALLARHGWYGQSVPPPVRPVGTKDPNPFALYDMHGSIRELCQDRYDERWYEKSPTVDPLQRVVQAQIVIRGGSWYYGPFPCRSASRQSLSITHRYWDLGFRVVRPLLR